MDRRGRDPARPGHEVVGAAVDGPERLPAAVAGRAQVDARPQYRERVQPLPGSRRLAGADLDPRTGGDPALLARAAAARDRPWRFALPHAAARPRAPVRRRRGEPDRPAAPRLRGGLPGVAAVAGV